MTSENEPGILTKVRKKLETRYKDSTELFPDFTTVKEIEVYPSPSAIINSIMGIGGLPRGRVTEIHGPYSSGKTTIATEIAAELQVTDPNSVVLFLDYEHAWDAVYARKLGMDLSDDRLIFSQPEYFEQGAAVVDAFVSHDLVDLIIIDSAAAMTPKAELEGEFDPTKGGTQKGLQAALMSQFLSVLTKKIPRGRKPAMLILNQTRAVINIGGPPRKNAPKEKPAGGNALKFYTSIRLLLEILVSEGAENRGTKITDQVYTQNRVRVTCIKNKLAPPWMRGELVMEYGTGVNNIISIGELAEAHLGIMSGSGYFKYDGDKAETSFSCRGREAFLDLLLKNPELQKEIELKVLATIRQKHAESLGIETIKASGHAKEIEGEAGVLYLDEGNGPKTPGMPVAD